MAPLSRLDFYTAHPEAEAPGRYRPGGYHPVHLGDLYCQRYRVIHKLGYGSYSTVWLARDLQSTVQTRYVALKFAVAELTGKNNEIRILHHLASRAGVHPGSDHVLTLLDHFKVKGVNGEHDVLVLPVIGPPLETRHHAGPAVIRRAIKSVMYQVALGTSFLHDSGVVHGDLHKRNIAFEVPDFDGKSEEDVLMTLGLPECTPVFARDQLHQTESLPKYAVLSGDLMGFVKQDDLRVKIIDLGGAFFSAEVPRELHTPIQVRAPEVLFNNLSALLKIEYGTRVDAWSIGCLIYELATSLTLIDNPRNTNGALHNLMITLGGDLPEEWMDSIETLPSSRCCNVPLEQRLRSSSKVDDTPGLIVLLQQILVLDPLRRLEVSEFLHHPWFTGSPSSTLSEPLSEKLGD